MPTHALNSLRRTVLSAAIATALLMTSVHPLLAQTSVPASAEQAAKLPQFAAKLAHGQSSVARPAKPRASYKKPAGNFAPPSGNWLPPDGVVYSNGPIDGETDAWAISFGYVVSDSFIVSASGGVDGLIFGAWLFPGDVLQSAEVSITSQPNGGTVYFNQTLSFNQSNCFTNNDGYNVCTETTAPITGLTLNAGTYWVNLQNAMTPSGDPVWWDENSGPSQAYDGSVGTIPSESFTLSGQGDEPSCYFSQGNLQILFDFTQQQGVTNGVVIDRAGNLYGTNGYGGNDGNGLAYKLSDFGSWILNPLFNFLGGDDGSQPTGAILGPNGSLYGGAAGGIQNCGIGGSQYCGLVYNLKPKPTVCSTATCGWNENVLYRFTSETDGAGTINASAFDQAGNLYGTTTAGGTQDLGTVFELTPSGGGWTKKTLYNFNGANGWGPTQVLLGSDGNLYGVASGGFFQDGVVFQLVPSGGQWTQSVIYPFGSEGDYGPSSLVQDSTGNLYGIAENSAPSYGVIFSLKKAGSRWNFSQYIVQHNEFDSLYNLTIDSAGNLYGTGSDGSNISGIRGNMPPGGNLTHDSYIFEASNDSNGWHYQDLEYLEGQYFPTGGSLALDGSGNLYGTTGACGGTNYGTVWKLSP